MKIEILGKKEDLGKMQAALKILERAIMITGIRADISLTHNFRAFQGSSFNPSMTPVIFIDGKVEYAGRVPEQKLLQIKFQQLKTGGAGGDLF